MSGKLDKPDEGLAVAVLSQECTGLFRTLRIVIVDQRLPSPKVPVRQDGTLESMFFTNFRFAAPDSQVGPVEIARGKIVGGRWKILRKLGEGGCGAVYKVEDITAKIPMQAALKAESNYVAGGSVLKLEVQILRRLAGRPHVAELHHCGKKETYCYMVMTLLGDSLNNLTRKLGRASSISTQIRTGINVLYGLKQLHDIGFVHRDLKPANVAIGRKYTCQDHFLHILDFGLAREFVVAGEDGKPKMRRPRPRALFRGTTRYCSVNSHERIEQGRVDDLWSLVYMLAEMRGPLPWSTTRDKKEVHEIKKRTEHDTLLENSPVELVQIAQHLGTLTYYSRPDYALMHSLLVGVMETGRFKFSDMWDWEKNRPNRTVSLERMEKAPELTQDSRYSKESVSKSKESIGFSTETTTAPLTVPLPVTGDARLPPITRDPTDETTFFPAEDFARNPLGF